MLNFKLLGTQGKARVGLLETAHGTIHTPAFMAVGTCATVKALTPEMIESTGTEVVLGNTYHLMLRPGLITLKICPVSTHKTLLKVKPLFSLFSFFG